LQRALVTAVGLILIAPQWKRLGFVKIVEEEWGVMISLAAIAELVIPLV
jgi:hypothetical protein